MSNKIMNAWHLYGPVLTEFLFVIRSDLSQHKKLDKHASNGGFFVVYHQVAKVDAIFTGNACWNGDYFGPS